MLKKSLFIVLIGLFAVSFIGIAMLSAEEGNKITGTVMSINADTGEMVIKDDAGEMKSLVADPKAGVDLKMLKEGDPVSVESDANGVIKSLEVSK
jgi:hypothetical protein